ncbi:MAG TPA: MMPL family transporter, partial [Ktedonobacterales bacterium]|nr:MMPL family transporter [Ktedonobacterales bacterium]
FGTLKSGGFLDPNAESTREANLVTSRFSNSSTDMVLVLRSDSLSVTDPAFADAANTLLTSLSARSEVQSVSSYFSTHNAAYLSRDGHETFALVRLTGADESAKDKQFTAIQGLLTSPTLQVLAGGDVPINVAFNTQIGKDIERAEMVTLPIVAILLVIIFGGLVAAALPLIIGAVAILLAFALLRPISGATSVSVFTTNVVTMLGLGLSIDYALFMTSRFREELALAGGDTRQALRRTMATAGRTVLFSGLTVGTSLLGLLVFPEFFLSSMGLASSMAVLAAMLASLTILPALLAVLGPRVNALSIGGALRRLRGRPNVAPADAHGVWYRLSMAVMRWPVPVALVVIVVLLGVGSPFLRARFSLTDVSALPADQPSRVATERFTRDFALQGGMQVDIAVRTPGSALSAANLASLDAYVRQLQALPGVVRVESLVTLDPSLTLSGYQQLYADPSASPQIAAAAARYANNDVTLLTVFATPQDLSPAAESLVRQVRAITPADGLRPLVGGFSATQVDTFSSLRAAIPQAALVVVLAMLVLLFLLTGSVLLPLKAIVLNTLSLSATFGALVWIFQDGHFAQALGFKAAGSLDATQPVLIFAIAFGLSMDYEVFLLSRIREQYDATGNNRLAVAAGLQRTGRLITSAALLLAVVLGAFATSGIVFIKMIGIGLAIAVIMDATLVRALLVPATMRLLGTWNWWAPRPLRALWRRVGIREAEAAPVQPAAEARDLAPAGARD